VSTALKPLDLRADLTRFVPRMVEVVAARGAEEYAQRQVGLAMLAAQKNPELLKCDPVSVATAMVRVCGWRLEIGTTAHLVPFGRECTAIPDYKGLIELMIRTGHVRDVYAAAVHAKDHFRLALGTDPKLEHEPAPGDRGAVLGYYAVAKLRHGYSTFEYMTDEEVERIRAAARSGNSPAWKGHRTEMGKKTVVRRLAKRIPQSDALRTALQSVEDVPVGEMEPALALVHGEQRALTDGRGNDGRLPMLRTPADDAYGVVDSVTGDDVAAETEA
jgi:recombination protein RecT